MKTGDMLLTGRAKKVKRVEQLTETAFSIIGLWNIGFTDSDKIAEVLAVKARRRPFMDATMAELRNSRNPSVRKWVDETLPPGRYKLLPYESAVRCGACRCMVNTVPCPACSITGRLKDYSQRGRK
jgi:hypothetical protein